MATGYTQHGDQSYKFGFNDPAASAIAAAIGMKPQTLSITGEPEFTSEAKNLNGLTEAFVVGDEKKTFTISGFITDIDLFNTNGITFTYENKKFIVSGRKRDVSNSEFQKGEMTGMHFSLIT